MIEHHHHRQPEDRINDTTYRTYNACGWIIPEVLTARMLPVRANINVSPKIPSIFLEEVWIKLLQIRETCFVRAQLSARGERSALQLRHNQHWRLDTLRAWEIISGLSAAVVRRCCPMPRALVFEHHLF
jgi:hypothetical protein